MAGLIGMVLLVCSVSGANSYTVTNAWDTGTGSLRWAVERANAHSGPDTIRFVGGMTGQVIRPTTALPALLDDGTNINGDTVGDGKPHIGLNGSRLTTGDGLQVQGDRCSVRGLAIYAFPWWGITLHRVWECRVSCCYINTSLTGRTSLPNGQGGIRLWQSHYNAIGGRVSRDVNVIAATNPEAVEGHQGCGIVLAGSQHNVLTANCIGLTAGGYAAFRDQGIGIYLQDADAAISVGNHIGGPDPEHGNCFAGLLYGVYIRGASRDNVVSHCAFGLGVDGDTEVAMDRSGFGVFLEAGTTGNVIGGTTAAARNVFAGGLNIAVRITGSGTDGNAVQGNYFGMNYRGTEQRSLRHGVLVSEGARATMIGGGTAAARNYFAHQIESGWTSGVEVRDADGTTFVKRNTFGELPNGAAVATPATVGLWVVRSDVWATSNRLYHLNSGMSAQEPGTTLRAFGNQFGNCLQAVTAGVDAQLVLGNLGNARTDDDGGNTFQLSNTWAIRNMTSNSVKAEGNDFRTTSAAAIEARIWDRQDDAALGRVDFSPLDGGVIPTGGANEPALTVTGATAVATTQGAEITFTLSAAASVSGEVLNLAGRPVSALPPHEGQAGLNRLTWSGLTAQGLHAPNGPYLIRLSVRAPSGAQSSALASLSLHRD